jgi:hypothetical protein
MVRYRLGEAVIAVAFRVDEGETEVCPYCGSPDGESETVMMATCMEALPELESVNILIEEIRRKPRREKGKVKGRQTSSSAAAAVGGNGC